MGRPCHGPPVTIKHPATSPRSRGSPCPVTPACPLLPAPLPGGGSWPQGTQALLPFLVSLLTARPPRASRCVSASPPRGAPSLHLVTVLSNLLRTLALSFVKYCGHIRGVVYFRWRC